jgi:hypothetical protein
MPMFTGFFSDTSLAIDNIRKIISINHPICLFELKLYCDISIEKSTILLFNLFLFKKAKCYTL